MADDPVVSRALVLVEPVPGPDGSGAEPTGESGVAEQTEPVRELLAVGDRQDLERARAELVRRIYQRSDDYQATAALTLVNKALATVGWPDPYNWKHRRKP
jgi:hypothetical protein